MKKLPSGRVHHGRGCTSPVQQGHQPRAEGLRGAPHRHQHRIVSHGHHSTHHHWHQPHGIHHPCLGRSCGFESQLLHHGSAVEKERWEQHSPGE